MSLSLSLTWTCSIASWRRRRRSSSSTVVAADVGPSSYRSRRDVSAGGGGRSTAGPGVRPASIDLAAARRRRPPPAPVRTPIGTQPTAADAHDVDSFIAVHQPNSGGGGGGDSLTAASAVRPPGRQSTRAQITPTNRHRRAYVTAANTTPIICGDCARYLCRVLKLAL